MTRVLIVDDDRHLLRALRITLAARGYDGATALAAASRHPPDLIILDLGLPDLDGVAVVHGLRGWSTAPIIVLSARHGESAKVAALDAGADDYVTKPFGMDELLARMRAALRRSAPATTTAVVSTEAFTVDLAAKRVTTPAGEVRLTPTEWHLLEVLVRESGRLVTHPSFCSRSGDRPTPPRPTTCACTWPTCAANSNPTPPGPATSSPNPASATTSPRPRQRVGRRSDRAPALVASRCARGGENGAAAPGARV